MKSLKHIGLALVGAASWALMTAPGAQAQKLTLYCSPQIEWCNLMVEAFETQTGIKVAMTRKSSGETFAQIKAESSNPKGDAGRRGGPDPVL
jgi:iron(III) transport system substrate-binding protein